MWLNLYVNYEWLESETLILQPSLFGANDFRIPGWRQLILRNLPRIFRAFSKRFLKFWSQLFGGGN
jgi:hypothetical protein